jgi:hypothetical protein
VLTINQPSTNQQVTINQPQYNKDNNNNKDNKYFLSPLGEVFGYKHHSLQGI